MKMLKKVVLVVGIMLFSLESFSQKTDTINKSKKDSVNIPKRAIAYAADKFAIVRPLTIEFTHSSPYNFTSDRGNISLPQSTVNQFEQAKISANFNFIKRKTWLLGTTLSYRYTSAEADMMDPFTNEIKAVD